MPPCGACVATDAADRVENGVDGMTVPQSLLVAALALAWLIVLVPMVSRKGRTVEETVEGRGFRVLQRSDSTSTPSRFRRRSSIISGGESVSGGESSSADEAEEAADSESSVLADYPQTEAAKRWLAAQTASRTTGELETDMIDRNEDTDMDSTTEIAVVEYDESESAESTEYVGGGIAPEFEEAEHEQAEYEEADYGQAGYAQPEIPEAAYQASYQEQAYEPVSHENHRRQGRGGFDPQAAEAARQFRYGKRQRVALILLVLTVLLGGAAVMLLPTLWIGAGVTGLLLVIYLTYLRRQVRIEEDVRQRRLARLQRARQIRPEHYNDAEVEYSHAPEYAADTYPASQIPGPAYDRRGRVVVDLEDDDPGFDDLDQYEPIVYKRASGQ